MSRIEWGQVLSVLVALAIVAWASTLFKTALEPPQVVIENRYIYQQK